MQKTYPKQIQQILPATLVAAILLAFAAPALADRDHRDDREDRREDRRQDRRENRRKGVTLYEREDFRGRSEFFFQDDPRLADNSIGNDRVGSVEVDRGCQITLFEDERYKGESVVLEDDARSLRGTRVGNNRASSVLVRCAGPGGTTDGSYGWGEGITLFTNSDFRGRSQSFTRDVRDLKRSQIGNDEASSLRIQRGCEAVLYADADFRGRSIRVTDDIEDLGRTRIGNDEVSSLEINCRRRRY